MLQEAARQYQPLLQYVLDWEAGMFDLTQDQYLRLPEHVLLARRLLCAARAEYASRQRKQLEKNLKGNR